MAYYNQNQSGAPDSSLGMNKKEETAPAAGAAPVQLTTASANGANAAAGPTAAPLSGNPVGQNNSPKPASSGMGGGFQSYQKANQGTAANRLGNAATQNVQQQSQVAQKGITQANDQFAKKVDAGTLANRFQAVQDVANTVNSARNVTAAPTINIAPNASQSPTIGQAPTTPAAPATATPAPAPTYGGLDQSKVNRFNEVINTKYQGPESLRQAGLYQEVADKVGTAQNTLNQTKTASGREEMLKDMYAKRGDYNRGLNKLDSAVLNSSQSGVGALQATAQNQGNLQNELSKAQTGSSNLSQNRTNEITDIRNQARTTFSESKKAEEAATDERLSKVVKDWDKLPEYFRNIIRSKEANSAVANTASAAELKASPAYLQAQEALKAAQAIPVNTKKLPSVGGMKSAPIQDTRARDAAVKAAQDTLSNLEKTAATPKGAIGFSKAEADMLGINSGEGLYNLGADAIKTAAFDKEKLVSIDEQLRQQVLSQLAGLDKSNNLDTNLKFNNAEKAGTQNASDALDKTGTRAALNEAEKDFRAYAEGEDITGFGSKKNKTNGKRYYAEQTDNLKDVLSRAGYDFEADNSKIVTPTAGNVIGRGSTSRDEDADNAFTAYQNQNTASQGLQLAQDIGSLGIAPALRQLGINIPGITDMGSKIGTAVFGGGANTGESKNKAKEIAIKDLQSKVEGAVDSSGFRNRFDVKDTEATKSRMSALQKILDDMDKTNS